MSALDQLNPRQRRFVEGIARGLPSRQAYIEAGYAARDGAADACASRTLKTAKVAAALKEIQEASPAIATAQDLQEFWSRTMTDGDECMKNRLKASEYLAKAGAMFTANHNVTHRTTAEVIDALERAYEGPS